MARTQSNYMTGKRNLPQPYEGFKQIIPLQIVLPAVLAIGDLIALAKIPAGVQIVDYDISAPQLDSNGAPTLAHSIGVENAAATDLATVFEAGLIFGRTASGSMSRCAVSIPGLDTTSASAERTISLKTTTAAATAALAGKTIFVMLHLVN